MDDDADIRAITLIALETVGGLEVAQCSSGRDALVRVGEFAPDLFLLDVMMPDLSGEQTLTALREIPHFAHTPAIFMTAKALKAEHAKLMELDVLEVITKPFDPMTLAENILRIWRRSLDTSSS